MMKFEIKDNKHFINSKEVPEDVFNLMVQEQAEKDDKKQNWKNEVKFFDKLPLKFDKKVVKEYKKNTPIEVDGDLIYADEHEQECDCEVCKTAHGLWSICSNMEYDEAREVIIEILEIYGQNQHDTGVAETFQNLGTTYLKNAGIIEAEVANNRVEFEDREYNDEDE